MIDISSLTLSKDDGTRITVTLEPIFITLPEARLFSGVYRILETDMTGNELGEVAFHQDDNQIWEFTGDRFSIEEQEQIVNFIREKEPFDSITFTETINGITSHFRISDNEGHFGIEKDGIFIAVIEHLKDWQQTEGKPLDDELFAKITAKIEASHD
ncbi:hypothetical protein FHW88_005275 [Mucilaginibacter sp. SG538B]|uniref:hypothetical protein n=1 Tax=Mucilaginibacter sp. SG538B TaxID=2587021 RepID=UPI00159CF30B|nr:hypothetical protein [Mucilaginibacter sp. SG538B]NVM66957.1 hypothetical protein [Mucilaginibacter sp. SG538B]